jgi:hypothetical protein
MAVGGAFPLAQALMGVHREWPIVEARLGYDL